MRLVTFNILHGRSPADGRVDLDRYRAAIRQLDPDILALQEVDRDQPRSQADLTALAADAMGAQTYRFTPTIAGTPGGSWVPATGDEPPGTAVYGIALLARCPARTWRIVRLPQLSAGVSVARDEPRAALIGVFDTPSGALTVAATHLSFVPGWNRVQLRAIRRALADLDGPMVLMGDLNLAPAPAARITGYRSLAARHTFPADRPRRQLDYLLVRDADGMAVRTADAPQVALSDHRPLLADVSW